MADSSLTAYRVVEMVEREVEIRRRRRVGPIPGAYHLLAGELPVPEASAQQQEITPG
jgi:hypothetical protein